MLEVKPTSQRGPTTTGSSRNGVVLEKLCHRYLHNEDRAMVSIKHE